MKKLFAKPRCEHGASSGERCDECRYFSEAENWLWDSVGWRFHWMFAFGFAGVAIVGLTVAAVVSSATYVMQSRECARYERIANGETDYDLLGGGCFVQTEDGNWVTLSTYKNQYNIKVR